MKTIRIEHDGGQHSMELETAIELYGRDELLEYLQGHHHEWIFFLTDSDSKELYVYPVTFDDLA